MATVTLREWFDLYLQSPAFREHGTSHQKLQVRIYKRCQPLHDLELGELKFSHVRQWLDAEYRQTPSAGRSAYNCLRMLLSRAVEDDELAANPLNGRKRSLDWTQSSPRDQVLTNAELRWLFTHFPRDAAGDCLRLLVLTGARVSEILGVRNVDIRNAQWTFQETKSGKPRTLPLTQRVEAILRPHRLKAGLPLASLFPIGRAAVRMRLQRYAARDDQRHLLLHSIRATVITRCHEHGLANPDHLRLTVGHKPADVHMAHYARGPMLEVKLRVLDAWESWLEDQGVIGGSTR